MMNKTTKILTLSVLALALGACSNIDRSRNLNNPKVSASTMATQACSICHGDIGTQYNGNSVNPTFPNLAGQQHDYIVAQLNSFQDKSRKDPAAKAFMWGITRNLTKEQIDGLATYFANQPAHPERSFTSSQEKPANLAEGNKIFNEGMLDKGVPACMGCHGADAHGNGVIPRLAGQHANYLYKQLTYFHADKDFSDKHPDTTTDADLNRPSGVVMEMMAGGLTKEQKHAVADYLQSLD